MISVFLSILCFELGLGHDKYVETNILLGTGKIQITVD